MQYLLPTLALSLAFMACGATPAETTLPPTSPEQVDAGDGDPAGLVVEENIVYSEPGTPVSYTSLDIYRRSGQTPGPTLVFVHGGSWMSGDKGNVSMSAGLVDYYIDRGYSFVAINHRLQNNAETPGTDYADQATDIAAALAWVRTNSERVGGLPDEIVLMGFSSGAHLVSLVATDPTYLALHQIKPTDLAGIIPLDVSAYDIPRAIEEACDQGFCRSVQNLPRIFGSDIAVQRLASPVHNIDSNSSYPPFFIVSAAINMGVEHSLTDFQSGYLVEALQAAGGQAAHYHANESHSALVLDYGVTGDLVTEQVEIFLSGIGK